MTQEMHKEIMTRATHIISKYRITKDSNRFIFVYRFNRARTIEHAMNKWAIVQQEIRFCTTSMHTALARKTFY